MTRTWFNTTFSSIHVALRLIREMDREGCYQIICSSSNQHAITALASHEFYQEPKGLSATEYRNWCLNFAKENDIQIFVPGKEASLISGSHDLFEAGGTRVLSATRPDMLDILHNKATFYAFVKSIFAPPPVWKAISNNIEFELAFDELSSLSAQLCIKPAVSVFGIGFRRIRTDKSDFDLMMQGSDHQISLHSLKEMLKQADVFPTLLLMEYLAGNEYSVDCLCNEGELVCAVPRKKNFQVGDGQLIDDRADIISACNEIVSQFFLNGYINIQFREGDQGLRVLEVNPRMSGGIGMACLSGINLPYLGLAGFDRGYECIDIPELVKGARVGEINLPVVLP
ncbi:MAG TPA: ATP-grasp domain-containing protein [Arenimonas sp.]|nr:ATP-grasp domain-containing protein [Arenimonas sp.]